MKASELIPRGFYEWCIASMVALCFCLMIAGIVSAAEKAIAKTFPAERPAIGYYLIKVYTHDGEALTISKTQTQVLFTETCVKWTDDHGKLRYVSGAVVILEEQ